MEYTENLRAQSRRLEVKVKTLLNAELKSICKSEGLPISGVKAALQQRILQRIQDAVTSGDSTRLNDLANKILPIGSQSPSTYPSNPIPQNNSHMMSSSSTLSGQSSPTAKYGGQPGHGSTSDPLHHETPALRFLFDVLQTDLPETLDRLHFKTNPFYEILDSLTNVFDLQAMHTTRSTVSAPLILSYQTVQRLESDQANRIMVYCATDLMGNLPVDIAFPNQVEIKVNGESYQGSLRGIKKKPGTTRPADITEIVRKNANYRNSVSFSYAGTDRRFHFVVNLVRRRSVDEMADRIKQGRRISKQSVINEMINKAKDPDIVATSTVMPLKCLLSYKRMILPCRSTLCNHIQCFDATSFLQLQEQAPQWTCPVCSSHISFDILAIDDYVLDILGSVPKSTEQVTINPDGTWEAGARSNDFKSPNGSTKKRVAETVDCDDAFPPQPLNLDYYSTPQFLARPSSITSREVSTATPSTNGHSTTSNKRPAPVVIDLTLSDDEDDPPPRPVKRQSTGSFVSSTGQQQQQQQQQQPQYAPPPLPQMTRGLSFQLPSHPHQTPTYPLPTHNHNMFPQGYGNWH